MTEWQPIDTAPRDGTRVLATWAPTWKESGPHIEVCETGEEGLWFYSYDGDAPAKPPTHWMPLPPPPGDMTDEATPIAPRAWVEWDGVDITLRLRSDDYTGDGANLRRQAADEIERLRASERRLSALLGEHIEAADDKHDALAVALEAAEKDAARYRWLRDSPGGVHWIDARMLRYDSSDALDAAIDAAMAATERG